MVKYVPDYYKILKINTNANKKTIKQAYKRLSKKYSPENNKSNRSQKMYKLIQDAYIVLSDDKKRKKYDKILNNTNNKSEKKVNVKKAANLASDIKDNYDLISRLFNFGTNAMKGKGLLTGTNIIIGSAMAGYGIKKGRDYMANRKRKNQ